MAVLVSPASTTAAGACRHLLEFGQGAVAGVSGEKRTSELRAACEAVQMAQEGTTATHPVKLRESPHGDRSGAHGTRSKPGLEKWTTSGQERRPWRAKLAEHHTKPTWGQNVHVGRRPTWRQIEWSKAMLHKEPAWGPPEHLDEVAHRVHIRRVCGLNLHSQCIHACNWTKHGVSVLRTECDNQASLKCLQWELMRNRTFKKKTAREVKPMPQQVTSRERCKASCKCPSKLLSTWQVQEEELKDMGNQCLSVAPFESAKLVWPPVVLGDASWLMTWSEQVNSQRIQCTVLAGRNP